jgi:hypothetical protein
MANKKQRRGKSPAASHEQTGDRAPDRTREQSASPRAQDESGQPGGGRGRRDAVGRSGVYPASGGQAPDDAELRGMASWGQGSRGAEGYADAGGSELVPHDGALLGGLDVGPSGAPIPDLPAEGEERDENEPKRSARQRKPNR